MAVLAAAGASSCDTAPSRPPVAVPPAPLISTEEAPTAADSVPPTAAQRGCHRYRGTLDGCPVQLELTVTPTSGGYTRHSADVKGFFRYLDTGKLLDVCRQCGFRPQEPLAIEAWFDRQANAWQAGLCSDQPVGPVLTGTYVLGRRMLPFRVQEDYSDCLRYELLEEETVGPPENHHGDTLYAAVERTYLHLLGPDTLRPAWARLQCHTPARRERARAALVRSTSAGTYFRHFVWVYLNEASLLACQLEDREEWSGSRNYEARIRQVLYDLRTGRELNILGQLQPGGRQRLHQLLSRQALADTTNARNRDHWRPDGGPLPLPARGFAVTPKGLTASYAEHESELDMYEYDRTISWADLRPLLRPDSPLRRLLKKQ